MSSEAAEKWLWTELNDDQRNELRSFMSAMLGYDAGAASRDAEVSALREALRWALKEGTFKDNCEGKYAEACELLTPTPSGDVRDAHGQSKWDIEQALEDSNDTE